MEARGRPRLVGGDRGAHAVGPRAPRRGRPGSPWPGQPLKFTCLTLFLSSEIACTLHTNVV